MLKMYIRKTSWEQDYIKDRYDPRSKHTPWKSKGIECQWSWVIWGRGGGGGGGGGCSESLSPLL